MRRRIFEIIEQSKDGDKTSLVYDLAMLVIILVSIIPLTFVHEYPVFHTIETVTITIFIIDYLLRWMTADYKVGKRGWSFLTYPFTGWAIIALPSGVITASYLDELRAIKQKKEEDPDEEAK